MLKAEKGLLQATLSYICAVRLMYLIPRNLWKIKRGNLPFTLFIQAFILRVFTPRDNLSFGNLLQKHVCTFLYVPVIYLYRFSFSIQRLQFNVGFKARVERFYCEEYCSLASHYPARRSGHIKTSVNRNQTAGVEFLRTKRRHIAAT